jgi:hypothetical protein
MFQSSINSQARRGRLGILTVGALLALLGIVLAMSASTASAKSSVAASKPHHDVQTLVKKARANASKYKGLGVSPSAAGLKRVSRSAGSARHGVHASTSLSCRAQWYVGLYCEVVFDPGSTRSMWNTLQPFVGSDLASWAARAAVGAACSALTYGSGVTVCTGAALLYGGRFIDQTRTAAGIGGCLRIGAAIVPYPPYVAMSPWDINTVTNSVRIDWSRLIPRVTVVPCG